MSKSLQDKVAAMFLQRPTESLKMPSGPKEQIGYTENNDSITTPTYSRLLAGWPRSFPWDNSGLCILDIFAKNAPQ